MLDVAGDLDAEGIVGMRGLVEDAGGVHGGQRVDKVGLEDRGVMSIGVKKEARRAIGKGKKQSLEIRHVYT